MTEPDYQWCAVSDHREPFDGTRDGDLSMSEVFDEKRDAEAVLAMWRGLGWNAWLERREIGDWERVL